jgi:CTP synthase
VDLLEEYGLFFSGFHRREDGTKLMEFLELPNHPFFVATQAHPEFKSRLERPAPLFYGLINSSIRCSGTGREESVQIEIET